MTLWFKNVQSVNSELMREIADAADVEFDEQSIKYRKAHVGYADAFEDSEKQPIIDTAQSEFGIILRDSEPPEPEDTKE